jgi:hypothetical protein
MTTTNGQLYIVNLTTLEKLEIQFVPSEVVIDRNASMPEVVIIGRDTPNYQWASGKQSLTLNLDFLSNDENRLDVKAKVDWLMGLTRKPNNTMKAPNVKLVWGDLFKDEVWVVPSVKPRYSNFNKVYNFLPQQAYVDITFQLEVQDEAKTYI